MFRPRLNVPGAVLVLALGAVALPASPAPAQQPPAPQQLSIMTIALLYTEDEAVDDELKLSEEQVRKLSEHRTKWFNDYWNSPLGRGAGRASGPRQAGELSKANDKALTDIFRPEQLTRLRELTLQAVEKQYGGRALRYPEVAEELKLSEEQLTRARTEGPEAVLTGEQEAKWQAMKGDTFKGALRPHVPARPVPFGGVNSPLATPAALRTVQCLFSISVQEELKLTDGQRAQVRGLRDRWRPVAGGTANQYRKEQTAKEIEQAAGELLKPEQKTRLEQIALQQELRSQHEDAVFILPKVVSALRLSAKQQKKIVTLRRERQEAYRDLFLSGASSDEIARKAEAFWKETYTKLAAVLSEEQQARLKDVLGEPFTGAVVSIVRTRTRQLPPPVPLVIAGLPFVEDKALHRELKLSEEQVKKLAEEYRKYLSLRPEEAVVRTTEKAVSDILSADQLKRFKQVALQQVPARGIAGYTDVVDGLTLTGAQKEELGDGEPLDTVLTRDQQAKWKEMLGEPFKDTLTRALPISVSEFQITPQVVRYLEQPSVQDELKLSDEQRRQVKGLAPLWQKVAKEREARKVIDQAVTDLLKPEQERRLRQIILQQLARAIPGATLAAAGVADKLSLTADQQEKIKAIKENHAKVLALIDNDTLLNPPGPGSLTFGGVPLGMHTALRRVTDGQLFGLLTEDQKAKLKELLGEPFKGDLRTAFRVPDLSAIGPARPSFAPPP
jgi:hypothetical protein